MADVRTPEDMERLMDRYGDRMLRLCCMYLNDEHMAQDAVQDSFLKIYRNAQTFETPEAEKSWVMRLAINTAGRSRRAVPGRAGTEAEIPGGHPSPLLSGAPCGRDRSNSAGAAIYGEHPPSPGQADAQPHVGRERPE